MAVVIVVLVVALALGAEWAAAEVDEMFGGPVVADDENMGDEAWAGEF